jgi:hypothetical protein
MSFVKCKCGTDLQLRDTITSNRFTATKLKVEISKVTNQPIVIQVRSFDVDQPQFSHSYSLVCHNCKTNLCVSDKLSEINEFILNLKTGLEK